MNENQFAPLEVNEAAPVYAEPVAVTGKKKEINLLAIGAAVLAVVILLAAIVIGSISSSPLALIATGLKNSVEALEESQSDSILYQISNGGSAEVSFDLTALLAESGLPLDSTGSVKIYMDSEAQKSVIRLGAQLGQQQNLTADIYLDQNSIAVSSKELLGDKAYGIQLQSFVEDFNSSIFNLDGPYSLGIAFPEDFQTQMNDYQKFAENTEEILEKAAIRLAKLFGENSTVEKENAALTMSGEEVKTTAVTVKMDHQQLAAFTAEVIEYLRTDEDIKKYLEENAEYLFQAYGASGGFDNASAFIEGLYQELDTAAAEMEETAKEMEESKFSTAITFHISKSGKQLIGYEQTGQVNGETGELRIYAGPDLAEAKEILFYMNENGQISEGRYTVKVNDEKSFVSLLDLTENGQNLLTADIHWDKQTGSLEVLANNEQGNSASLQGTLKEADREVTFDLESITVDGAETALNIKTVLHAQDPMPAAPQFSEILKFTKDEMDGLVENVGAAILQIMLGLM